MTPEDVIGVLSIVNTLLIVALGWLIHSIGQIRADLASTATGVTVLRNELVPDGGRSLSVRVGALERDVAVLKAKDTP